MTKWDAYQKAWAWGLNRGGKIISYVNSSFEDGIFTGRDESGEILFAVEMQTPAQAA